MQRLVQRYVFLVAQRVGLRRMLVEYVCLAALHHSSGIRLLKHAYKFVRIISGLTLILASVRHHAASRQSTETIRQRAVLLTVLVNPLPSLMIPPTIVSLSARQHLTTSETL